MSRLVSTVLGAAAAISFVCASALADEVTFTTNQGNFARLDGSATGLEFKNVEVDIGAFISSKSGSPVLWSGNPLFISTGPMVFGSETFAIYNTATISADTNYGGFVPLPPGFATCEEAGLFAWIDGCRLDASLWGYSPGQVTLLFGPTSAFNSETGDHWATVRDFSLFGHLYFDISDQLALALGVGSGPYLGAFRLQGKYYHDGSIDPGIPGLSDFDHSIRDESLLVTGTTVPEPSSIALLATVAGALALALKRRLPNGTRFQRPRNLGI